MQNKYIKEFDRWNEVAKNIDHTQSDDYFYERDIWWCIFGVNIGAELDGKNEAFERPVIVLKKINTEKLLIVPLSSKSHKHPYRLPIKIGMSVSDVLLTEVRTISNKRLIRKVSKIKVATYLEILFRVTFLLLNPFSQNETPQ